MGSEEMFGFTVQLDRFEGCLLLPTFTDHIDAFVVFEVVTSRWTRGHLTFRCLLLKTDEFVHFAHKASSVPFGFLVYVNIEV